jgi:hypothetical protein
MPKKMLSALLFSSTAKNNSTIWDNNNLQDNEGLIDPDPNSHPGIPAEFPGINLEIRAALPPSRGQSN